MQWIKPRTLHIQGKHCEIDLHLWKGVLEIRCFVSYIRYLTFSISLLRLFFFLCLYVCFKCGLKGNGWFKFLHHKQKNKIQIVPIPTYVEVEMKDSYDSYLVQAQKIVFLNLVHNCD